MAIDRDKLEKDIEKWVKAYANAYCDKAADLLTEYARLAILKFYDSYKPLYYDRTLQLKYGGSYERYKHNNGRTIWGGVRIYADNLDYGKKTKKENEQVLGMTFFHGYHGEIVKEYDDPYYYVGKHYMDIPPASFAYLINDNGFKSKLNDYAVKEAKKQTYDVISKFIEKGI